MTAIALDPADAPAPGLLRRHGPAAVVVLAMLALFVFTTMSLALRDPAVDVARQPVPPAQLVELKQAAAETSATQLRNVAPTDAVAINASIPTSDAANPAARPFSMDRYGPADRTRALDCLTAAIYYEAATEPTDGQRGVAQVVLNRARHPAYPSTVCGVVFEGARRYTGCQFSFSCDGSLRRAPMASYWTRARQVAEAALNGYVHAPVGWATHYHANYVVPYWASSLVKSATIGNHIFYRWRGGWGRPNSFLNRFGGAEPAIAWRGGFGQPDMAEAQGERDALAAEAAREGGTAPHSVDSFHRAVLRRYEPLRRETADAIIAERARSGAPMSNSQRWALTGATNESEEEAPPQRPLGRWGVAPAEAPRAVTPPPPSRAPSAPPATTAEPTGTQSAAASGGEPGETAAR